MFIVKNTKTCFKRRKSFAKKRDENVINAFQVAAIGSGESGQDQGEELVLSPRTQQEAADHGAEDEIVFEP